VEPAVLLYGRQNLVKNWRLGRLKREFKAISNFIE
jgi:hypothetical protein